jgi:hypothetical protein
MRMDNVASIDLAATQSPERISAVAAQATSPRDAVAERYAKLPWNTLWQQGGNVITNNELPARVEHAVGDACAAGATGQVFRGRLLVAGGTCLDQVVVKYHHTMANLDAVRMADAVIEQAAERHPAIRNHYTT